MNEWVHQIGEIEGFSTKPFLEAAELLARADEPERALAILDNLPAYYRETTPADINQLREQILFSLCTPHVYATVDMDATIDVENSTAQVKGLFRGAVVKDLVEKLNAEEKTPHVIEMGPGEYWLPIGLERLGYRFTYQDISLLQRTARQAREILPAELFKKDPPEGAPVIFVAYELIEHLPWPRELCVEALRQGGKMPDYVFLSTPMCTFDGHKEKDWKRRTGQPHLRAYTPQEFFMQARGIFPGYDWELKADSLMVLKGIRHAVQL
jgi:hypothetical protein